MKNKRWMRVLATGLLAAMIQGAAHAQAPVLKDESVEDYNKLKDINEKGGNLLLNIGPDGNGVVQPEAYEILTKTAELLKAQPITKSIPKITEVPDGSKR